MRHPPMGMSVPTSCENAEVSGAKNVLANGAQTIEERPPAVSSRKAPRPYVRDSPRSPGSGSGVGCTRLLRNQVDDQNSHRSHSVATAAPVTERGRPKFDPPR